MKIAVCIKQVPATQEVTMDPRTGTLVRDGAAARTNPYDLPAVEVALRLREELGGQVIAITMGPPAAEAAIREAAAMGADQGVLLSDPAFAGADVLATAYTLRQALSRLDGFDLVLFGRQTTDGDTAQVGPAVCAGLDIGFAGWVEELCAWDQAGVTVRQALSGCLQTVRLPYPCGLAVNQTVAVPRLPTLKGKLSAKRLVIPRLGLADMEDTDPGHYGLDASPTQVERIFLPEARASRPPVTGSGKELAAHIHQAAGPYLTEGTNEGRGPRNG